MRGLRVFGALFLGLISSCGTKRDASAANFTKGMGAYLERYGDLCLGKTEWPIDLRKRPIVVGDRDAVQMPVLERLGLVSSADALAKVTTEDGSGNVEIRRYRLTDEGRRYYRAKLGHDDLCVAKLSLDKVVRWETSTDDQRRQHALVTYTYKADAAPWTQDPENPTGLPGRRPGRERRGRGGTHGRVHADARWLGGQRALGTERPGGRDGGTERVERQPVSVVVHFSPELSAWLVEKLDEGAPPEGLITTMMGSGVDPRVARAIVGAFLSARARRAPVPVDAVTVEEGLDVVDEAPIFRAVSRIATNDRLVRVFARSENPVMAVLGDVVSAEECAELIELARPRLQPSTVVDPETGNDVVVEHRNSFGMFFRPAENSFIARLDSRISEVMNLPVENGEGFQVLYYPVGALNAPHYDFLVTSNAANRASIARSGQRVSTMLTYLNDVESGGETVFPATGWTITPERGHAVYFEYGNGRGEVDSRSLHASNPIVRGEKWVATKWMRQRRFVSAGGAGSGRDDTVEHPSQLGRAPAERAWCMLRFRARLLRCSPLPPSAFDRCEGSRYDQLIALGAFQNEHIELLEGVLVPMSPIGPPHSSAVTKLTTLLIRQLADRRRSGLRTPSPHTSCPSRSRTSPSCRPATTTRATPTRRTSSSKSRIRRSPRTGASSSGSTRSAAYPNIGSSI